MIDIDSANGRTQIAQILTDVVFVWWKGACAIAGRKVEIALRIKANRASVVATGRPGQQNFFTAWIDHRRLRFRHPKTTQPRTVGLRDRIPGVDDENLSIVSELGMNSDCKCV